MPKIAKAMSRIISSNSHAPPARATLLMLALGIALSLAACMNDLTPQGRWSSPVTDGEYIYVGNLDGVLVRLNAATHAYDINWLFPYEQDGSTKKPKGLGAIYGAPTVIDDAVYSAGYTCRGNVCEAQAFALTAEGGLPAWISGSHAMKTKIISRLQPTDNGLLVLGTSAVDGEREPKGYLYALHQQPDATRRVAWRVALDGEAWGDAAVNGSMAYIGTDAGTLYAVNLIDDAGFESDPSSRIEWTYNAGGAITGPILAHDNRIYFGDLSGKFYRLHPATGQLDWSFEAGNWVWAKATPDDKTDNIYLGTLGGEIFAIDRNSGTEIWSRKVGGQIVGAPLLFERERNTFTQRLLAVPSGDQDVHIIHVPDGETLGVLSTDQPVKSTPALINGMIYVHTMNGELMWFSPEDQTMQGCVALKDGGRCG